MNKFAVIFLGFMVGAWLAQTVGCVRVRAYQQQATDKCEAHHTAKQCKPLPYPSCPDGGGCAGGER